MTLDADRIYALARRELTDKQFDAWRLAVWHGLSQRRTATLLGISRNALLDRLTAADRKVIRAVRHDLEREEVAA